jgi:hypothetical protein
MREPASLVLGPRGCGKSEFVEQLLLRLEPPMRRIYMGTVDDGDPENYEMVERHRQRRGPDWVVLETSGSSSDIDDLDNTLSAIDGPVVCMIDGLTNWVMTWSGQRGDILGNAVLLGDFVADLVTGHPGVEWWLLDVLPESFAAEDQLVCAHACALLHRSIAAQLPDLRLLTFEKGGLHERIQDHLG